MDDAWPALQDDVRRRIGRYVHQPEVVDDLVQEVFLRVHTRADSLRDTERLPAWVGRIARNVALDHLRRRSPEPLDGHEPVVEPPVADGTAQVASWMPAMVETLPEPYRTAVRLSELDGLPQAEVARQLGISASGARTRVQRGRKLLREHLLACCPVRFEDGVVVDTGLPRCPSC